jgi:hypothetical protein
MAFLYQTDLLLKKRTEIDELYQREFDLIEDAMDNTGESDSEEEP